ncbi:MAG: aminotransferase class III-fold pyridoxal phosphate-dependent enzyme [Alphaproteobacteria bacterium]|nr:aminotransferase class III-fold pyridoxal phosphate-dependent enzyme [Alphaproteobacteria bacterium]
MTTIPNNLEPLWMPFSWNRELKQNPMLVSHAEGINYTTPAGKKILDSASGLWCSNAGHCQPHISAAIASAAQTLDYVPSFTFSHPDAFNAANQLTQLAPDNLSYAFFSCTGSEAVDTAIKIALAYHNATGQKQRSRIVARQRGYHGVNIGGTSLSGIHKNRAQFANLMPYVSHLRHAYLPEQDRFSRGQPPHGAELADDLESIAQTYGPDTIAAVIVEPVSGSAGVFAPPVGYLERLREICDRHGILLVFDEVITAFGRIGHPFAAQRFGVTPDIITCAKGLTNGAFPVGATICDGKIYDALLAHAEKNGEMIELFHGTTYAAHPVGAAALLATLEFYERENLFQRARDLEPVFEDEIHALRDAPNVADIRNIGLMGAVELKSREDGMGRRAFEVVRRCFEHGDGDKNTRGLMVRSTGDTLAFSPPLIAEADDIREIFAVVRASLGAVS